MRMGQGKSAGIFPRIACKAGASGFAVGRAAWQEAGALSGEARLAFLRGEYAPPRDMVLLTFDDGLKEHYAEVMPLLAEAHVQGQFFLITSCLENGAVAPVHMNHFLMAKLEFPEYRDAFVEKRDAKFEGGGGGRS